MPNAKMVKQRLLQRIAQSEHALTVVYPPGKPAAIGVSPGTGPVSPLTGPTQTLQAIATPPTPAKPSVTVQCLWYDAFLGGVGQLNQARVDVGPVGWVQGAECLARVDIQDAAIDAQDPSGNTIFTGADYVTHFGHHYRVMSVIPVGAGFIQPYTYYVWLQGATKQ